MKHLKVGFYFKLTMDKSQTVKISPKIDKKALVSFKIIHEKEATPEAAPEKELVTKPRG